MESYIEFKLNNRSLRFYSENRIDIQDVKNDWRPLAITLNTNGYRSIQFYFDGKKRHFKLHRVVYFAYNQTWNIYDSSYNNTIDHQDQNKNNNHISNLKIATAQQQMCNRNHKGVCWVEALKKWRARITINGVRKHLGYFDEYQDAIDAYQKAKLKRDIDVWNK